MFASPHTFEYILLHFDRIRDIRAVFIVSKETQNMANRALENCRELRDYYYILCVTDRKRTISTGHMHYLGIINDRFGSIVEYSYKRKRDIISPPKGRMFVQVSAGNTYSVGLLDDGTVIFWPVNYENDYVNVSHIQETKPPRGRKFIQVDAGACTALGLLDDGSIRFWDVTYRRRLAHDVKPPRGRKFIQVSTEIGYSLGLLDDSSVMFWNDNRHALKSEGSVKPPNNLKIIQISVGGYHSLGLLSDGTVMCWGSNIHGQAPPEGVYPPLGRKFIQVSAGGFHSAGLLDNGAVIFWGSNRNGQAPCIMDPPCGRKFVEVDAGMYTSAILLDDMTRLSVLGMTENEIKRYGTLQLKTMPEHYIMIYAKQYSCEMYIALVCIIVTFYLL